jgi:hypothetical protein
VRALGYILEICGWALVVFTGVWTAMSVVDFAASATESGLWNRIRLVGSLLGYLLEGVIFGLVAVIVARLARHPEAPSLVGQAARMLGQSRRWDGKSDD